MPEAATLANGPLRHWREYLIEAFALGAFMVSAAGFAVLLEHPASPLRGVLPSDLLRRALMGLAMGLTAIAIIYSPWGKRSGAHMNPSVTLTFLRLRKIERRDALGYVVAQLAGGVLGLAAIGLVLREALGAASVRWVATVPGPSGALPAFVAEAAISFVLMAVVLLVSSTPRLARYTGLCAGALVAAWITFEAPLSGMSMNPARTLASALAGGVWDGWWIYCSAPPLGMLAAAELWLALSSKRPVRCAKLCQDPAHPCIFRCACTPCAAAPESNQAA